MPPDSRPFGPGCYSERVAVLSRAKIKAGGARYYAEQVASGLEDYMAGHGEAPGVWSGSGAAVEDLRGQVTAEQINLMYEGEHARHPVSGEVLGRPYAVGDDRDKVMGWDLTASAPKSFSALWAVADEHLGAVLDEIHASAVDEAIAYLEEHAAFSRRGRGGVAQVDTHGLLIARFEHRTSRAMDPQRHSHLLVSGRVRGVDGEWRALDSRALHPQLKAAGTVYQAALRAEGTARLGLHWGPATDDGQADIVGVPEELMAMWSKRRRAVERRASRAIAEREAHLGRTLSDTERREIYQRATLETREGKQRDVGGHANVHDLWRRDAAAAGLAPEDWVGLVLQPSTRLEDPDPQSVVAGALAHLETHHSTWGRPDAVQQVAARLPAGLASSAGEARAWIERLSDEVVRSAEVVEIAREPLPPAREFTRLDGRSVFEPHNLTRYTTRTTIALEEHVLVAASRGREAHRAVGDARRFMDVVEAHGLSDDQAKALERVVLGGEALICMVGPAGTGKTRIIGAAADLWSGRPIRGLAVSAVAAEILAIEADIPADTVAKLLYENDRAGGPDDDWRLKHGEIVIVDEASQVATADLSRLVDLVEAVEGKLVLVGDHRQLGAVEAGGLFRLLVNDGAATELSAVHRFWQGWERSATLGLRDRDGSILDEYERHHRLLGGSREEVLDLSYRWWLDARAKGTSTVVMATDRATVDALAMRIRASLVGAGDVEAGGLEVGEQIIGVGDEIVTLRNDRRLVTSNQHWVRNGDRWRVQRRTEQGGLWVESVTGRGAVHLPPGYAREHVALGYAVTLQKAQGMTVDHGIVLADEAMTELGLYVGMTRGRLSNHALVATDRSQPEHQRWKRSPTAKEVLVRVLERDSAERSALEALRDTMGPEQFDRISARIEHLLRTVEVNAGPDPGRQATWLNDHPEVRDLRHRLERRLDAYFARGSERQADRDPEVEVGLEL